MKYTLIGYTDSVNVCDCCGKTELKGTFVLADEMENELYFGRVCGTNALKWSADTFNKEYKKIESNKKVKIAVEEAQSQPYLQEKVLKLVKKLNLDLNKFIKENGKIVDEINDFKTYSYGLRCYNLY